MRLDARLLADDAGASAVLFLLAVAVVARIRLLHPGGGREEDIKARAFRQGQHFGGNRFGRVAAIPVEGR